MHFNPDGSHDYTLEPDGRKTSYTYNGDGSVATMAITPPGRSTPSHVWSFAYQNGKLASITDPAGRVTHFTIDDTATWCRSPSPTTPPAASGTTRAA